MSSAFPPWAPAFVGALPEMGSAAFGFDKLRANG